MKDGISAGTLSPQSGDHGETLDPLNLNRRKVVKGPATLLYGFNAIGGVVNAITPQGETIDGFEGKAILPIIGKGNKPRLASCPMDLSSFFGSFF